MRNLSRFLKSHRKIALALLLATVVASASAATYYALSNSTVVTVNKTKVAFCTTSGNCAGAVTPADAVASGATLGTNNTYVALTSIKAYPNATGIYEQAVGVSNSDTSAHNVRIRINGSPGVTGTSTAFQTITVQIVNAAGPPGVNQGGTLTFTGGASWSSGGSPTTFVSLPASTTWFIQVQATGAASNSISSSANTATVTIFLDSQ